MEWMQSILQAEYFRIVHRILGVLGKNIFENPSMASWANQDLASNYHRPDNIWYSKANLHVRLPRALPAPRGDAFGSTKSQYP